MWAPLVSRETRLEIANKPTENKKHVSRETNECY